MIASLPLRVFCQSLQNRFDNLVILLEKTSLRHFPHSFHVGNCKRSGHPLLNNFFGCNSLYQCTGTHTSPKKVTDAATGHFFPSSMIRTLTITSLNSSNLNVNTMRRYFSYRFNCTWDKLLYRTVLLKLSKASSKLFLFGR